MKFQSYHLNFMKHTANDRQIAEITKRKQTKYQAQYKKEKRFPESTLPALEKNS